MSRTFWGLLIIAGLGLVIYSSQKTKLAKVEPKGELKSPSKELAFEWWKLRSKPFIGMGTAERMGKIKAELDRKMGEEEATKYLREQAEKIGVDPRLRQFV